jgi:hypothetical protein
MLLAEISVVAIALGKHVTIPLENVQRHQNGANGIKMYKIAYRAINIYSKIRRRSLNQLAIPMINLTSTRSKTVLSYKHDYLNKIKSQADHALIFSRYCFVACAVSSFFTS